MSEKLSEKCPICGESASIRNPTGKCDHLYYPENLDPEKLLLIFKALEANRDALASDAEKWRGYLEIIDTVQKKAGEMDLHLEENPLRLPLTYLHTAMDYINEAANHIRTRNRLAKVEKALRGRG